MCKRLKGGEDRGRQTATLPGSTCADGAAGDDATGEEMVGAEVAAGVVDRSRGPRD